MVCVYIYVYMWELFCFNYTSRNTLLPQRWFWTGGLWSLGYSYGLVRGSTLPPLIMCHQTWLLLEDQPHLAKRKCSTRRPFSVSYSFLQTTQIALDEASRSTGLPQTPPQGSPRSCTKTVPSAFAWKKTFPFCVKPNSIPASSCVTCMRSK